MQIMGIPIGTVITLIGYLVAGIVGYTKLNQKVKQNSDDVQQLYNIMDKCKAEHKTEQKDFMGQINRRFQLMNLQIADIKKEVSNISGQLQKLNGILETYIKTMAGK